MFPAALFAIDNAHRTLGQHGNNSWHCGAVCPSDRAAFKLARFRCCLPAKAGEPANNASVAAARTVFLIINFISCSTRTSPATFNMEISARQ
jgi:hypothetical protein